MRGVAEAGAGRQLRCPGGAPSLPPPTSETRGRGMKNGTEKGLAVKLSQETIVSHAPFLKHMAVSPTLPSGL